MTVVLGVLMLMEPLIAPWDRLFGRSHFNFIRFQYMSHVARKPVFWDFQAVWLQKMARGLYILDLESSGIVPSM